MNHEQRLTGGIRKAVRTIAADRRDAAVFDVESRKRRYSFTTKGLMRLIVALSLLLGFGLAVGRVVEHWMLYCRLEKEEKYCRDMALQCLHMPNGTADENEGNVPSIPAWWVAGTSTSTQYRSLDSLQWTKKADEFARMKNNVWKKW